VELVLLGDILDLQRLGPAGKVDDRVIATLTRPDYRALLDVLRSFRRGAGQRVTLRRYFADLLDVRRHVGAVRLSPPRLPVRRTGGNLVPRRTDMKYMLLIHSGGEARAHFDGLSEEEQGQIVREYLAISAMPGVLDNNQLHPADTATTVRVEGGRTLMTDGPFIEMKEALGGYYLYEADNLDAAIELAARIPAARMGGAIEVRPVVER
jgi:hypothetical protein